MAAFLQWGAVVILLSLIALQSQAQEEAIIPPELPPSVDEAFQTEGGTDRDVLTLEEWKMFVKVKLGRFIPYPDMQEELNIMADTNNDHQVDKEEYKSFINNHILNTEN
ncbi:hypothetical protein GJAV_G00007660 [Gymnothorax javanicus]|nr:hypothetical protein GJAV_G00007660 [Gymnothorax javanicus]